MYVVAAVYLCSYISATPPNSYRFMTYEEKEFNP